MSQLSALPSRVVRPDGSEAALAGLPEAEQQAFEAAFTDRLRRALADALHEKPSLAAIGRS